VEGLGCISCGSRAREYEGLFWPSCFILPADQGRGHSTQSRWATQSQPAVATTTAWTQRSRPLWYVYALHGREAPRHDQVPCAMRCVQVDSVSRWQTWLVHPHSRVSFALPSMVCQREALKEQRKQKRQASREDELEKKREGEQRTGAH
jgi:hypothetical protein